MLNILSKTLTCYCDNLTFFLPFLSRTCLSSALLVYFVPTFFSVSTLLPCTFLCHALISCALSTNAFLSCGYLNFILFSISLPMTITITLFKLTKETSILLRVSTMFACYCLVHFTIQKTSKKCQKDI